MSLKQYPIPFGIIASLVTLLVILLLGAQLQPLPPLLDYIYLFIVWMGIPFGVLASCWRKYKVFGITFAASWFILIIVLLILGGYALQSAGDLR